jgi:chaperone modulatory protein CbpM
METSEFLLQTGIDAAMLEAWCDAGWLAPEQEGGICRYSEVDLARVRLILDLKHDFGANDEAIPIILDLLDQLYGLRWKLAAFRRHVIEEIRVDGREAASGHGSSDD